MNELVTVIAILQTVYAEISAGLRAHPVLTSTVFWVAWAIFFAWWARDFQESFYAHLDKRYVRRTEWRNRP